MLILIDFLFFFSEAIFHTESNEIFRKVNKLKIYLKNLKNFFYIWLHCQSETIKIAKKQKKKNKKKEKQHTYNKIIK